jgi:hypothetical protein
MLLPRNRLSPRYINIATTRYSKLARATAQTSPKEKKRKGREIEKKKKRKKVISTTSGRRKQ